MARTAEEGALFAVLSDDEEAANWVLETFNNRELIELSDAIMRLDELISEILFKRGEGPRAD